MSEELAVDGSFGYGATVDGKILLSATWLVVVDNTWQYLLTYSTLADYKHRQVSRRHLQGNVYCTIQGLAVSHDVVSLLDSLQFRTIHF